MLSVPEDRAFLTAGWSMDSRFCGNHQGGGGNGNMYRQNTMGLGALAQQGLRGLGEGRQLGISLIQPTLRLVHPFVKCRVGGKGGAGSRLVVPAQASCCP